ncbi:Mce protein [Mycolicibacterium wolinskyi]|uniref:Mce protein n=1 Tax=Mycolicibacterium wolinskyi TaxID=59750 RepID=UPI0039176942
MADESPDDESIESPEDEDTADETAGDEAEAEPEPEARPMSRIRLGALVGSAVAVVLAGLTGWLGYLAYQSQSAERHRDMMLEAGRQAAFSLTNVGWETADADVQRVLDSAGGKFYDDFEKRAESYREVVKQVKSKSEGTITGSALESISDGQAKVLVSVTVKSSNAGVPEQAPQYWRMVLTVQENEGTAKVSELEFVE